jgi:hypothetical protein
VVLILETGHVEVEILYSFVELTDVSLESVDLLVVEVVVGLEICFQAGYDSVTFINLPLQFLDLHVSFLQFGIQIDEHVIVALVFGLLIIDDIIHFIFKKLDVSMQF